MRALGLTAALAIACSAVAAGQLPPARSEDYLFPSATPDVRALWINPAGPASPSLASLLAEVAFARDSGGSRLSQYSFGAGSHSAAVGYQRNRLETGEAFGVWRLAGAVPLGKLSAGSAVAFHKSGRAWDVGLEYTPAPSLGLAFVVRNIGRPVVRDSTIRLTWVVGADWRPTPRLILAADGTGVERRPVAGYDIRHRLGGQLLLPTRWPVTALTALEFGSGLRFDRWSIGLALGGMNQLIGVVSALRNGAGLGVLESYSVTALAKNVVRR